MIAYKILLRRGGDLFSANPHLPPKYQIKYTKGKTILPVKGSKLFVFDNILSATYFINDNILPWQRNKEKSGIWELWSVQAKILKMKPFIAMTYKGGDIGIWIDHVWEKRSGLSAPLGSKFAASLKLVKKLRTFA